MDGFRVNGGWQEWASLMVVAGAVWFLLRRFLAQPPKSPAVTVGDRLARGLAKSSGSHVTNGGSDETVNAQTSQPSTTGLEDRSR